MRPPARSAGGARPGLDSVSRIAHRRGIFAGFILVRHCGALCACTSQDTSWHGVIPSAIICGSADLRNPALDDVVIVGGGPTGFITALGLAQAGVAVTVIESEPQIV